MSHFFFYSTSNIVHFAVDEKFKGTKIAKFFEVEERGSSLSGELKGAFATFMTMAYILAVNPRIIADSGGPCVPDDDGIFGPAYSACMEEFRKELITVTALVSMFGCILMGVTANLPIALAPGMGMNAYFTYSVVGFRGTGSVSYQAAVTACIIEGAIFFVLAVTGVRYALVRLVPEPIRYATPAAIGAFLAHLGLQTAEGIGLVVSDIATAVTLGGCPLEKRVPIVALTEACSEIGICVTSDAYTCDDLGGIMTSGTTWIGIFGMLVMLIFMAYKWNSALIIGIGFVTVVSWFRNTAVTYFDESPAGEARFEYFKQVVSVETLDMTLAPFTSDLGQVGLALITFLYVDFLDTSGTLMGIVSSMGYVNEEGDFPKSTRAFAVDALGTMFSAIFGCSPVTSYIESAAGVEAGAKTGLTAVFCGFFFFISIFFAPIIASIPPWAVGGALIIVGALMARSLAKVKWYDVTHASTAFVTVMIMPLTYSIAYGLIAGLLVWTVMQSVFKILSFAGIEPPSFEPETMEEAIPEKEIIDSSEKIEDVETPAE